MLIVVSSRTGWLRRMHAHRKDWRAMRSLLLTPRSEPHLDEPSCVGGRLNLLHLPNDLLFEDGGRWAPHGRVACARAWSLAYISSHGK